MWPEPNLNLNPKVLNMLFLILLSHLWNSNLLGKQQGKLFQLFQQLAKLTMFTILLYFTPSIQDNLLIATTKTGILHDQISVAILCMQLMKNYGGLHEKSLFLYVE